MTVAYARREICVNKSLSDGVQSTHACVMVSNEIDYSDIL